MNKYQLLERVLVESHSDHSLKEASQFLQSVLETIKKAVRDEKRVEIDGLGSFKRIRKPTPPRPDEEIRFSPSRTFAAIAPESEERETA